jgi:hypothetical protein
MNDYLHLTFKLRVLHSSVSYLWVPHVLLHRTSVQIA